MIDAQRIVIADLRIPLTFFIKAALALIPAVIIVGFLLMSATALVAATLGDHSFSVRRWTF